MKNITFITGNSNKAAQVAKYLSIPVKHKKVDLTEIQSLDLKEIVKHKAKEAFKEVKGPVLIEDVSLTFHALGKLPGPLIKWFMEEIGVDKLPKLLSPYTNKSATSEVLYGLYDGKNLITFSGKVKGTIAEEPRGTRGFGFDVIFIPEGKNMTRGEMPEEEFVKYNHRTIALKKLEDYLNNEK
jgi:non-canonical purine NTP pyrophosphatase (RdgB/HAM1 family)